MELRHRLRLRAGLKTTALAALMALGACSTTPPSRTPADLPPTAGRLAELAAPFEAFTRGATAIDPTIASPAQVTQDLAAGAAYEPRALSAALVAYAALAAREDPRFAQAVRAAARRDHDLPRRLAADPDLALTLPGATAAAARAGAALKARGEALAADGRQVKTASYGLQKRAWAKARVADPQARLLRVKAIGSASGSGLAGPGTDYRPTPVAREAGPSPAARRGVALAALSVLGEDGRRGARLLDEPRSGMCLRLAKLNFHQCLASAGPYYEDVWCLGQHAMIEPAACVTAAGGK